MIWRMEKKNRTSHWIWAALVCVVLSGCRSTRVEPRDEYADTITMAGTYADLSFGGYAGFVAVSNVLRYGDFGLGTFDGLDGEMLIYSGEVYRIDGTLTAAPAPVDATTPYAAVTFFSPERMFDVARMDQPLFQRALAIRRKNDRLPQAILVQGVFETMHIRSVPGQVAPWKPLSEALASDSAKTTLTNVSGRMVGFYIPASFETLHPAGYHFHFIRDDLTTGGHVLDFKIAQARIEVDHSTRLHVLVNTNATGAASVSQPR
jgi:acetolactate decarboxylase